MPYFEFSNEVSVREFLENCRPGDIKDLIYFLVQDNHLPNSLFDKEDRTVIENDFCEKLDKLKKHYYSLNDEDELLLNTLFKKYL
jgi:hypothetical protein